MALPGRVPNLSSSYRSAGSGQGLRAPELPFGAPFTVCGWASREYSDDTNWHTIWSIDNGTSGGLLYDYFPWSQIEYNDGSAWRTNAIPNGDDPRVTARAIFFWAVVVSTLSAGGFSAYMVRPGGRLNGVTSTYGVDLSFGGTMRFARDGWDQWFGGRLWNCRIWRRALRLNELQREVSAIVPSSQDLWGWWPLEGNSNQLTRDWSGNRRHLTLEGGGRSSFFVPSSSLLVPRSPLAKVPAAGAAPTLVAASITNLAATTATANLSFTR